MSVHNGVDPFEVIRCSVSYKPKIKQVKVVAVMSSGNGQQKKDRASREAPQTLNLVSMEQAEGINVLDSVCI